MPFTPHPSPAKDDGAGSSAPPAQSAADALDETDRILHQMLLMAELSASDASVDRDSLQKVLERLRNKIDRIADGL